MNMIPFSPYFQKTNLKTFRYLYTDLLKDFINLFSDDQTSIFCYENEMVHQYRYVVLLSN